MKLQVHPNIYQFEGNPFLKHIDPKGLFYGMPWGSYFSGVYNGIIILLLLIFLVLFAISRDALIGYLALILMGILLATPMETLRRVEFSIFYIWYEQAPWLEAISYFGMALTTVSILKYAEKYLDLKSIVPFVGQIINGFILLYSVVTFFMVFRQFDPNIYPAWIPLFPIFRIGLIVGSVLAFSSAAWASIKKQPNAVYFLIAILPYTLGITIAYGPAANLFVIFIPFHYFDLVRWSGLFSAIFLAIGIGVHILYLRQKETEAKRLQELDNFKSKLYTNITHEFRTPLTVIQGMAKERVQDTEAQQLIQRNSQNLLSLVQQLLDLPKIDAGKLQLQPVQSNVVLFLKYVVESFHSLAFQKGINLTFYTELEELWMDYDPQRLQQVLSNLITNALKFTPEYGKVLLVAKKSSHNQLQLTIRDNGIGIPESELEYVFERFHQVKGQEGGTGIGLALAKELVKLMNGSITVQSQLEKGTTFTIHLPVTTVAPKAAAPEFTAAIVPVTDIAEGQQIDAEQPQLLIVEDNADVRTYLQTILAGHYQLAFAKNGKIGLEKALESIPDIILTDVMMPELDGFELTKRLKTDERTSHIPVILLTARADTASKLEGLEYGADAYLIKPFDKEELFIRLRKLLELRRKLQARYQSLQPATETASKAIQQEDAFLQKLREVVEANITDENFRIPEICKAMGVSRTQLHRKLKALTGRSTSQVINSIRLQKARHLLETTDWNVSQVAYEVGFQDHSYFSRLFQQEFGVLPSELK